MSTVKELTAMSTYSNQWRAGFAAAVKGLLESRPDEAYSPTDLMKLFGLDAEWGSTESRSFTNKLHLLKAEMPWPGIGATPKKRAASRMQGWDSPLLRALAAECSYRGSSRKASCSPPSPQPSPAVH